MAWAILSNHHKKINKSHHMIKMEKKIFHLHLDCMLTLPGLHLKPVRNQNQMHITLSGIIATLVL